MATMLVWPETILHGTYAGAQVHQRLGIPTCIACATARAEYMAAYRAANPVKKRDQRNRTRVRNRALARLAKRYPTEFNQLLMEEMKRDKRERGES